MPDSWASCLQPKPRFQWEQSSGTPSKSQAFNCGPTGSTQQADFYQDRGTRESKPYYGIEGSRLLAGVSQGRPTNAWEQANMLDRRGVPATVLFLDRLADLDLLLGTHGRRPIGIGVDMSRLTARTRGHTFLGMHRLTILKPARRRRKRDGVWKMVRGYVYTDPNFNPQWRPDPKKGHRWISRAELRHAWVLDPNPAHPMVAIVPDKRKGA